MAKTMTLREALLLEIEAPGGILKASLRQIIRQYPDHPIINDPGDVAFLPNGSVIQDKHGDVAEKRDGLWCGYECAVMTDAQMAKYLPITVLKVGRK